MSEPAIELETTLAWAKGACTVAVSLGHQERQANLVLDSGSSTLAVTTRGYDPAADAAMTPTSLAQRIDYGGGGWTGPVLRSRLSLGHGHHRREAGDVPFALIETECAALRDADGLFGLAFRALDPAHDLGPLLAAGGKPATTWPWPFPSGHADEAGAATFADTLRRQPGCTLPPALDALVAAGVLPDRFALMTGRAVVHVASGRADSAAQAGDPLNRGVFVPGGGAERQHLYRGAFADVRVVHPLYFDARLRAVAVGGEPPIPVPPSAQPDRGNALLDTGSSFLVLEPTVYDAVVAAIGRHDPRLPPLLAASATALASGSTLAHDGIHADAWPDLHLVLEAPGGGDTVLRVRASQYWPANALAHGRTIALLMRGLEGFDGRSILGLPVFAGRYAVFDRTGGDGVVVRFADGRFGAEAPPT